MATIINSSTNPQGLIQTSDGTAVLKIQTGGNDAIVFDSSQNVTVNNDLTVSGDASVTGNVVITGTLSATGTTTLGNATLTGNMTVQAQGDVRFADADSSNYVAIQAPSTIATNFTLTLPTTDGVANQALITDGSGNLSFANVAADVQGVVGESFHPFLLSGM
jgi:trimeric autotransporter adhesin